MSNSDKYTKEQVARFREWMWKQSRENPEFFTKYFSDNPQEAQVALEWIENLKQEAKEYYNNDIMLALYHMCEKFKAAAIAYNITEQLMENQQEQE